MARSKAQSILLRISLGISGRRLCLQLSVMNRAYKHRPDDFSREIVATVSSSRTDLLRREEIWLDRIHKSQFGKSVYNLRRGALNRWFADEQKRMTVGEKISQAKLGRECGPHTAETQAKINAANTGQKRSAESRAKMRAAWSRRRDRGWTHSAEARARVSAALKCRKCSDETRAKLRAAGTGRSPSPETRAKLSAAMKRREERGWTHSPQHSEKVRAANSRRKERGDYVSPEYRAKMSAVARQYPRRRMTLQIAAHVIDEHVPVDARPA